MKNSTINVDIVLAPLWGTRSSRANAFLQRIEYGHPIAGVPFSSMGTIIKKGSLMELTGNTADRWEQTSNKIAEIALDVASKQELIKSIVSTLNELIVDLDTERDMLEKLGNLAYKEVLREESGTLNDETPIVQDPTPSTESTKEKQTKPSTEKTPEKSVAKNTESSELPLLKNTEIAESKVKNKQSHQKED